MIAEILADIRTVLEPGDAIAKDLTDAKPFAYAPATLYVYPERVSEVPIETGPTRRRDFTVRVELTGPDAGEESGQARDGSVSAFLDERRGAYFAAVRANERGARWDHLRAAEDPNGPATLQVRGIGLRLSGYQIVS